MERNQERAHCRVEAEHSRPASWERCVSPESEGGPEYRVAFARRPSSSGQCLFRQKQDRHVRERADDRAEQCYRESYPEKHAETSPIGGPESGEFRARWLLEDAGGARNSEVSSFRVALPMLRIECLAQLLNLSKVSCSSMSAAHLRDVREIVVQSVPALFGQANECGPLVRRMRLPCDQLLLLQIFDPS